MSENPKWLGEEHGRLPRPGKIVNRSELARLFDVVPSTINKWQELGLPVLRKGRRGVSDQFDSADCLWWRIDYVVRQKSGELGDSLSTRKLLANTRIKEMEAERAMKAVAPVTAFVEICEQVFANVRERLDAIASEAAPLVASEMDVMECHHILETAINNCRRKLVDRAAFMETMGLKQ